MFDLSRFGLRERLAVGVGLMRATRHATTVRGAAEAVVRYVHEEARHPTTQDRACASVRFYLTRAFGALTAEDQAAARHVLGGGFIADEMKCLVLMAGAGEETVQRRGPGTRALGAAAVPLASARFVGEMPLIAQLLHQFGFPLGAVVPDPAVLRVPEGKSYGVVHVEHARGSLYMLSDDASNDAPTGEGGATACRSLLGFGGLLAGGRGRVARAHRRPSADPCGECRELPDGRSRPDSAVSIV